MILEFSLFRNIATFANRCMLSVYNLSTSPMSIEGRADFSLIRDGGAQVQAQSPVVQNVGIKGRSCRLKLVSPVQFQREYCDSVH